MSDVKWIKITTDIFNDEKIQLIESMPDGDSILVIWFKLLALAGKSNNGGLVIISDKVAYTPEMLATLFRRKKSVIDLALHTFVQFSMIEILDNDAILISNWEKHQSEDKLKQIREGQRKRQKDYRERKKNEVTFALHNGLHNCNALELELEEELEKEETPPIIPPKEKGELKKKTGIPYEEIIDYLNLKSGKKYRLGETNKKPIRARWEKDGFRLDDFLKCIDNAFAFRKASGGDFSNMKPTILFNTSMESRVNGDAYSWFYEKNGKTNGKSYDDY